MLLLHQVGSVKIGEVVRYTVTYTPSQDRILPASEKLHVRIRNTSTIVRRAAFVRGPYTLSVSAHPAGFDANSTFTDARRCGVPVFEPMLKAGGSWECELVVPEDIRPTAGAGFAGETGDAESASWIIEVASQVIFSPSVSVGYELVVARDAKSLNLTSSAMSVGQSQLPLPGRVSDQQQSIGAKDGHHPAQPRGVFSRAVHLKVEDTATLWNTPRLPAWDDDDDAGRQSLDESVETDADHEEAHEREKKKKRKKKKVHLVVLTHGLHSNLGADMLYLKESIDAAAKQAKQAKREANNDDGDGDDDDDDDDDEQVIVRGYSGNATKTERGIKYLGKRLARYVLSMTYPDQPLIPIGKGSGEGFSQGNTTTTNDHNHHHPHQKPDSDHVPAHKHSTIQTDATLESRIRARRPFTITSISFIGHSLGGLVQMYAVAYIQKHSPQFFDLIKPINFIALATPFLGLSNENPLYVRFALDFGLVGRSGQDMGLTWRAPTIARSGWGAIVSNLGESAHRKVYGDTVPESKPLLRILPTGPAHTALKKFRNRTVYSNVVNDGIVPLRTSCLLFLDWQGLGRVDKARRDAGLVQTVVGFGWAELTGTNMLTSRTRQQQQQQPGSEAQTDSGSSTPRGTMHQVPQPMPGEATDEDDRASIRALPMPHHDQADEVQEASGGGSSKSNNNSSSNNSNNNNNNIGGPFAGFFKFFQSSSNNEPAKEKNLSQKQKMILRRGQTMPLDQAPIEPADGYSSSSSSKGNNSSSKKKKKKKATAMDDEQIGIMKAPPRTTFFESAGDLLNPSLPDAEYLVDPSKRPRAIFHDRIYHPSDIPPPPPTPPKRRHSSRRKAAAAASQKMTAPSGDSSPTGGDHGNDTQTPSAAEESSDAVPVENSGNNKNNRSGSRSSSSSSDVIRVEEKIARGYHRDLSWRKVLVKLEPDAHNNILVRRKFPNAFGWPVIKHLVDAHFSVDAPLHATDEDFQTGERALDPSRPPDEHGVETVDRDTSTAKTMASEEARDEVSDLPTLKKDDDEEEEGGEEGDENAASSSSASLRPRERADSVTWSERDWQDSDAESEPETGPKKRPLSLSLVNNNNKPSPSIPSSIPASKEEKRKSTPTNQDAQHQHQKSQNQQRQTSSSSTSSSWNWTEKIVGKGAAARGRSMSPKPQPQGRAVDGGRET
ncbi:hypothetical protein CP532_6728 [Ophiocordyceps camponoti-leonardi (nom. inval.)]|nr:hypothetical protein CP532_6728 [Ophiocordyceps camponoti-leonardi (nom. inval.)]